MSEKVSGAEHTKLDDNFVQMEKITDVFLEVEVSFVFYFCFCTTIFHLYETPYCQDRFNSHIFYLQDEMFEKTRDYLYPNPAVRVKQVSDKGIASIGVSILSCDRKSSIYLYISTKFSNFSLII